MQYATEIHYNNRPMTEQHLRALLMVARISCYLGKNGIKADELTNKGVIRLSGYARTLAEWYCTWMAMLVVHERTAFLIAEKQKVSKRGKP